jgi:hypothetical protein
MFPAKLKLAATALLRVGTAVCTVGLLVGQAPAEDKSLAQKDDVSRTGKKAGAQEGRAVADRELAGWVEKRIQEWEPTAADRRFDEIGWAKDIRDAERLAKEHDRPVFLFTHDGRMAIGRC